MPFLACTLVFNFKTIHHFAIGPGDRKHSPPYILLNCRWISVDYTLTAHSDFRFGCNFQTAEHRHSRSSTIESYKFHASLNSVTNSCNQNLPSTNITQLTDCTLYVFETLRTKLHFLPRPFSLVHSFRAAFPLDSKFTLLRPVFKERPRLDDLVPVFWVLWSSSRFVVFPVPSDPKCRRSPSCWSRCRQWRTNDVSACSGRRRSAVVLSKCPRCLWSELNKRRTGRQVPVASCNKNKVVDKASVHKINTVLN